MNSLNQLVELEKNVGSLIQFVKTLAIYNVYAKYFDITPTKTQIKSLDGYVQLIAREYDNWDTLETQANAKTAERKAIKDAERALQDAKDAEEMINDFRTFKKRDISYRYISGNTALLRYNPKTRRVETSKGVEIPVELAKRFYTWVQRTLKTGGCVGECNYKLMDFEVRAVNENELIVGCHTVAMSEADAIAKLLNW